MIGTNKEKVLGEPWDYGFFRYLYYRIRYRKRKKVLPPAIRDANP